MARRIALGMLVAALILTAAPNAAADATWLSRHGLFRLTYSSELDPVVINTMHSWTLRITDADAAPVTGATISVSGGMPAHNHGLPSAARVTREIEPGTYLLEGLRFHMRGQWQLEFTIDDGSRRDVVVIPLEL